MIIPMLCVIIFVILVVWLLLPWVGRVMLVVYIFIITLTLADERLDAFYDNPNSLRDYFRDIGRMVLAAEGRKANDSHADCYQYFCVPEYGTANGRLHFHAVHFMRTLPTG